MNLYEGVHGFTPFPPESMLRSLWLYPPPRLSFPWQSLGRKDDIAHCLSPVHPGSVEDPVAQISPQKGQCS